MNTVQSLTVSTPDATVGYESLALAAIIGHHTTTFDGPLVGAFAIPLKAVVTTPKNQTLASLSVADYDGHAPIPLTWNPAVLDENGDPYCLANRITVLPTGHATITSQQITGVAIVGSDSVTLMMARNLPAPVVVSDTVPLFIDITLSLLPPAHPE